MKTKNYKDLVTDAELQQVMDNNPAMFGTKPGREWLITGLNNARQGYSNGSGVTSLLQMFGLINKSEGTRNKYLTKKGLAYLLSVAEEKKSESDVATRDALVAALVSQAKQNTYDSFRLQHRGEDLEEKAFEYANDNWRKYLTDRARAVLVRVGEIESK